MAFNFFLIFEGTTGPTCSEIVAAIQGDDEGETKISKEDQEKICSLVKLVYAQQKRDKNRKTVGVLSVEELSDDKK